MAVDNFATRLAQAKLATKADIANSVKKTYIHAKLININRKVNLNKTRHVMVQNK